MTASNVVQQAHERIRNVTYTVSERCPFSERDAKVYGQALADLAKTHGTERLTPQLVVDAARDPDNPLHAYFTWDTEKGMQKLWKLEARKLINHIQVRVEFVNTQTKDVRVVTRKSWVNLPTGPSGTREYVGISTVIKTPSMRRIAFEEFRKAAQRFMHTARSFNDPELDPHIADLEGILKRMDQQFRRRV